MCITTYKYMCPSNTNLFWSSNATFFLYLHAIAYSANFTIPCSSEKVA